VKQVAMTGDAASGSVLIEILVPRTGGDDYWQYRSTPATGAVTRVGAGRYAEGVWLTPIPPTGRTTCSHGIVRAPSPDGRFVVECDESDGTQARVSIRDEEKGGYAWHPREWRGVDGFAWSPNSRAIALLNHSSRRKLWQGPYNTYYLMVVSLEPREAVEYVIRTDVRGGDGAQIVDWHR
jgi:hypothetical protein